MNKVTKINLNGRAYQLEEQGFEALRKYLETAAAKLEGNPDKDEIMADFEQAIADKCDQKLAGHKNVISEREIEEIIAAMGPVEGTTESSNTKNDADSNTAKTASSTNASSPRRLFRIPQGEWIMGVCRGLGAYFNIDVTLIRIIFILLIIFTHGFGILAYIILAVVMPVAKTEKQIAQAHGWSQTPPFNAHDFIEEASKRYAEIHDQFQKMHDEHRAKNYGSSTMNEDAAAGAADVAASVDAAKEAGQKAKEAAYKWKHEFKQEMRQKKERMRQEWREQQQVRRRERYAAQDHNPGWVVAQVFLGIFSVIVSVAIATLSIVWVLAIISLVKYGTVLGYAIGAGQPIWIPIVFLTAALYIIIVPLASLLHGAWGAAYYRDARRSGWESFGRAFIFIVMLVALFLSARELFPQVETWWNTAIGWLNTRV